MLCLFKRYGSIAPYTDSVVSGPTKDEIVDLMNCRLTLLSKASRAFGLLIRVCVISSDISSAT